MEPELVNKQKNNIEQVINTLQTFQPTKIAVEKPFLVEEELDRNYQKYRRGDFSPVYDEAEQFGFPLASHFSHPRLYPVDDIVDMSSPSLNQVFEWAKEHQPDLFQEIIGVQSRLKEMENHSTLIDKLHYLNDPAYIKELQRVYVKLARVGDRQHQIGVRWLKQWHERDLAISANITRLVESDDRLLVIIGSDHLHLLHRFLTDSGDYHIVDPLDYLPK
ncbi:DUF5694 domain-containing protein [Halobacillus amylolyticus]|uniref:DUF5694 domain-containing protein n=1 Tax=Halobacillus amylolyticus TaxID=2932259 RepID=A0ABY4HFJ4_9BACI|nr:DUF5694 domain-containing protein [Halobacillus amylolyticus]UOR13399.1 DUF5694 domain-containing protein [Halobacillus amylolyticus]